MAGGERGMAQRAVVAERPRVRPRPAAGAERFLPAGRWIGLALLLLALGMSAYALAVHTPLFAVRTIEVRGAPTSVERQMRAALGSLAGSSLVTLDRDEVERRLDALPTVRSFAYDRDFPHTLRVEVVAERPVAVLRHGADAWLVSLTGRVLARVPRRGYPRLPRVWAGRETALAAGARVDEALDARAVEAAGAIAGSALGGRIASVRAEDGSITMRVRSGVELRLGRPVRLAVKLAAAARILADEPAVERASYLDLTQPTRPVAGPPQPSSRR